jgi:hypothetical protein
METTYSHLSDEDHIRAAEMAAGIRDADERSTLSPDICHCGEPLPDAAAACPRCGTVYRPDAKSAIDQIQDDVKQDYRDADPNDTNPTAQAALDGVDTIDDLVTDPEDKAKLLHILSDALDADNDST